MTDLFPGKIRTFCGADGATIPGFAGAEGTDASPSPKKLVATTTKVYSVPLVSPRTVHEVVFVVVQVKPPGVDVTVYKVMGVKPLLSGAVHDTVTNLSPLVAFTFLGAEGNMGIVIAADDTESVPEPSTLVAETVKV